MQEPLGMSPWACRLLRRLANYAQVCLSGCTKFRDESADPSMKNFTDEQLHRRPPTALEGAEATGAQCYESRCGASHAHFESCIGRSTSETMALLPVQMCAKVHYWYQTQAACGNDHCKRWK